jgi:hypothetical protein
MSSKWQWNGIDLWVSSEDITREIKRAELFVLNATDSVYHFFGTGSRKRTIKGFIIGSDNANSLDDDATGNVKRTLTIPLGTIPNLRISSIKLTRKQFSGGTIDGVTYLADTTAIYEYEIELIEAA